MEKSWEIERIFNDDIRNKKRTGSNIFKRAATRKGGSNKPLKSQSYFLSTKQKKALNGKMRSYNMDEIMTYEKYKEENEETQKMLLKHWREHNTNEQICNKMKISSNTLYKILLEYNMLGKKGRRARHIELGNKKFQIDENNVLTWEEFKGLDYEEKQEIWNVLSANYTVNEMAENWNINTKDIYNFRNHLRKKLKKEEVIENKEINETPIQNKEENSDIVIKENNQSELKTLEITEDFFFTFNKMNADRKSLLRKLRYLIEEVEDSDENVIFDVQIGVRGSERK